MQYTAIIKDGGLFIPNVFSDINDGGSHIVQVEVDIADVRQQLSASVELKTDAPRAPKKQVKKQTKKEVQKTLENADVSTLRKSALDELEALDDSELSEMFKAYMNDGQESSQISLENL
ncbi:hypothetical protein [Psychrobacter aquaticus]|uniref:RelB/StbD replicon stabilization protein (Antitoxin to RelE/StbE) n=1 Tax=Psychrobacter aquaticus CMS 56 TaxID=1354303 RepID=U4T8F8_9GAMM|nr:hypothetical protein [Psychrobacter aquaticus]ERL54758.1 RelB/StbD replicon stabilization protein (antitoxin to RelE/StbE) [Psychrobacter aquaticus CMS 56]